MDYHASDDAVTRRVEFFTDREKVLRENDLYFYNRPVEEIKGGARVIVNGHELGLYAPYSYLDLIATRASTGLLKPTYTSLALAPMECDCWLANEYA
ncbi:MAG: hypothetical protein ABSF99_04830 [Anaerolineales bacterium]|jgi:hypothetical protein